MRLWLRSTLGTLAVRFGPSLLIIVAIVALLAADRQERLGYVRALAWPMVALVGFALFKDVLRERLGAVLRASLPGVEVELQERQNNAVLQEQVREAASVLTEDEEAQERPSESEGQSVNGSERPTPVPPPASGPGVQEVLNQTREILDQEKAQRRAAVEQAIKAGAEWGYRMAALYEAVPKPVIEWNNQGEPTITGARGTRRQDPTTAPLGGNARRGHDLVEVRSRAEDDVRRLERELYEARFIADPMGRFAVEDQLKEAKRRLSRVDPTSHLLL